jgi:glutathione S-transferase
MMSDRPEYLLYCMAQSGNAYRVALMLNLIGADWKPVFVDFFIAGETRTEKFRTEINEMGEVPVLDHGGRKFSQSAVCLTYLAKRSGKFRPEGEEEELECLRWLIFDNQKVNGFLGPYRFLKNFAPAPSPGGEAFLLGRLGITLPIVDKRLATSPYLLGQRPTIADVSLAGYVYYPPEEFGFDIAKDHPHIGAWMERMKALPGWKHPYELMPGYPLKRA